MITETAQFLLEIVNSTTEVIPLVSYDVVTGTSSRQAFIQFLISLLGTWFPGKTGLVGVVSEIANRVISISKSPNIWTAVKLLPDLAVKIGSLLLPFIPGVSQAAIAAKFVGSAYSIVSFA